MSWLDLLCLILATGAVIDAWRNGSIFQGARPEIAAPSDPLYRQLLACDFCLGYHVAFWLVALGWWLARQLPEPWASGLLVPLYGLAVCRVAWIGNGLLPDRLRYQKSPAAVSDGGAIAIDLATLDRVMPDLQSDKPAATRRPKAIFGLKVSNPNDRHAFVFAYYYCSAACRDRARSTVSEIEAARILVAQNIDNDDELYVDPAPAAICQYCGKLINRRIESTESEESP